MTWSIRKAVPTVVGAVLGFAIGFGVIWRMAGGKFIEDKSLRPLTQEERAMGFVDRRSPPMKDRDKEQALLTGGILGILGALIGRSFR